MLYLTPRRPRGEQSLTNHRFEYLKSVGCRDRSPASPAVQRAVLQVEGVNIGGRQ
jgi:hypothetical protein